MQGKKTLTVEERSTRSAGVNGDILNSQEIFSFRRTDSSESTEGGFLLFSFCFFFLAGLNCPFKLRQMTGWVGVQIPSDGPGLFASLLIRCVSKLRLE